MDGRRISIAILALGGQGGGVLADWVAAAADDGGWRSQITSVPGVAQRTGTTVYYVELFPANGPEPIAALMPTPGDVDIVIASELMEAGRAVLRGFVSEDRTTLIASTHRVYAISEKMARGDGRAASERILAASRERSKRLVAFDMEAAADRAGSVISSVMLGALAGSESLPFGAENFERAIRASGIATDANLRGFAEGLKQARVSFARSPPGVDDPPQPPPSSPAPLAPTTTEGRRLSARIRAELPATAHVLATEGAKRMLDYQDVAYADLYLDRLRRVAAVDGTLVPEAARHLALWMSFEDTIRVADLKTRATRLERVRGEVRVAPGQILSVTEFMHPRLREVCETLPAGLGRFILTRPRLMRFIEPAFSRGRHVRTTGVRWFAAMRLLAALRPMRRRTLRFREEDARIRDWLDLVVTIGTHNVPAALELIRCQSLVKGYGETHERGIREFGVITGLVEAVADRADAAEVARHLREVALANEDGRALDDAIHSINQAERAALASAC